MDLVGLAAGAGFWTNTDIGVENGSHVAIITVFLRDPDH
jgi:hypothetical protein